MQEGSKGEAISSQQKSLEYFTLGEIDKGVGVGNEGSAKRARKKVNCIKVKRDKVKLSAGLDVKMEEVDYLMAKTFVDKFMKNGTSGGALRNLLEVWLKLFIGSVLRFYI